jgi:uncharacterized protein (DUF1800 family)
MPSNSLLLPRAGAVSSVFCVVAVLAGCAAPANQPQAVAAKSVESQQRYAWFNRLSWGATASQMDANAALSPDAYLAAQLRPEPAVLPQRVAGQIAAMTISQRTLVQLVQDMEQRRKDADAVVDNDQKKAAQQAYQQEINRLAREAATRHLLRGLYSANQVQEQMTWFWLNHFNVHQAKSNLRAMVGDYEDSAIRPHALGRFRDLLGAVTTHPAMLRYLDNEQNAAGRLNENLAREVMELHTMGVTGGYSQQDVQQMARVLTGAGVNLQATEPKLKPELRPYYVHRGLFEFNPNRHDFGPKTLLGQPIQAKGLAEVDEALDRLARHPATAAFVSRKLAQFWLADEPPAALVQRMAASFQATDGDIAATLKTLFTSAEFAQGAGGKFKDPMHYVMSSVRLAYDDKPILNAGPILNWLSRMGEPLYGHATPDGYALDQAAWASPGQMATRFEIAKAIGSGNAGLFKSDGPSPQERAAFPQLSNALYFQSIKKSLGAGTLAALDQAASPQEWNMYLLAAPEMMVR